MQLLLAFCTLAVLISSTHAGEADVVGVDIIKSPDGSFRFDVTVLHADAGWDHYANHWQVVGPSGAVLGTRTLYHPHVHEQPFTRSLSGVAVPPAVDTVSIRAHDLVHGHGGKEMAVPVPH